MYYLIVVEEGVTESNTSSVRTKVQSYNGWVPGNFPVIGKCSILRIQENSVLFAVEAHNEENALFSKDWRKEYIKIKKKITDSLAQIANEFNEGHN